MQLHARCCVPYTAPSCPGTRPHRGLPRSWRACASVSRRGSRTPPAQRMQRCASRMSRHRRSKHAKAQQYRAVVGVLLKDIVVSCTHSTWEQERGKRRRRSHGSQSAEGGHRSCKGRIQKHYDEAVQSWTALNGPQDCCRRYQQYLS